MHLINAQITPHFGSKGANGPRYVKIECCFACPVCGSVHTYAHWSVGLKLKHCKKHGDNFKHGLRKSHRDLYSVWSQMRGRCNCSSNPAFHNYGGRGIKVCHEWDTDALAFVTWALANGWKPGLEIERKNNNDGYKPSNCTFITKGEQARNRRTSKLTYDDVREIRRRLSSYKTGDGVKLAKEFGVQPNIICGIRKNRIWKGVH